MDIMYENQPTFFYEMYKYLDTTQKQLIKFYTSSKRLLVYIKDIKIDKYFYTPKTNDEIIVAVLTWCENRDLAILTYGNIATWNTINITSMCDLFEYMIYFNDNIEDWNTSNVTDMSFMFHGTGSFNQSVKNWDISSVKYMSCMFRNAKSFNQSIHKWNTKNVLDITDMFEGADSYTYSIPSNKCCNIC